MVAKSGPGWTLAPSLVALVDQADAAWPHRARGSDGSIGDARHQGIASDHNPDEDGDVLAVDITEDWVAGPSLVELWNHLVAIRDPRVRYLIYEGSIIKAYRDSRGRPAWVTQRYDGINAHAHHLHVSIHDTDAAKGDTGPWFPNGVAALLPPMKITARPYPGVVRLGDRGHAVGAWQQALRERGYPWLVVDGIFGPATHHIVWHFQTAHGLTADGIAGPATWHAVLFA